MPKDDDAKSGSVAQEDAIIFDLAGIVQFGARLKILMGDRSFREMAAVCDMSEKVIRNYVKNETYPSLDRLVKLAAATGVTPEWLAFGKEEKSSKGFKDAKVELSSKQEQPIMMVWEAMSVAEQQSLLRLFLRIGVKGLLKLAEDRYQNLLELKGIRLEAALTLVSLPESRVREILAVAGRYSDDLATHHRS